MIKSTISGNEQSRSMLEGSMFENLEIVSRRFLEIREFYVAGRVRVMEILRLLRRWIIQLAIFSKGHYRNRLHSPWQLLIRTQKSMYRTNWFRSISNLIPYIGRIITLSCVMKSDGERMNGRVQFTIRMARVINATLGKFARNAS